MTVSTEWRALFNGRNLDGWVMTGPGGFDVEDLCLATRGGMGLLYYAGEDFGDCEFRVVFRMTGPADNSGIFIRIDGPPPDPWHAVHRGYEVQIFNSDDPLKSNGALYSLAGPADPVRIRPGEWTECLIRLEADRTRVFLNGRLVTDYREGDPVPPRRFDYEPERGPRPRRGYFGLQNHDDGSRVLFREIEVRSP